MSLLIYFMYLTTSPAIALYLLIPCHREVKARAASSKSEGSKAVSHAYSKLHLPPLRKLRHLSPATQWLPGYKWRTMLWSDIIAGFMAGIMAIPQGEMKIDACLVALVYA